MRREILPEKRKNGTEIAADPASRDVPLERKTFEP